MIVRGRIGQDWMRPGGAVQGPTFGSRTDMGQLEVDPIWDLRGVLQMGDTSKWHFCIVTMMINHWILRGL